MSYGFLSTNKPKKHINYLYVELRSIFIANEHTPIQKEKTTELLVFSNRSYFHSYRSILLGFNIIQNNKRVYSFPSYQHHYNQCS